MELVLASSITKISLFFHYSKSQWSKCPIYNWDSNKMDVGDNPC